MACKPSAILAIEMLALKAGKNKNQKIKEVKFQTIWK